jgi:hypothetical protein
MADTPSNTSNNVAPANDNRATDTETATNDTPLRLRRQDIHDQWEKISHGEADDVATTAHLVILVQAKYGMSPKQARRDVAAWADGGEF